MARPERTTEATKAESGAAESRRRILDVAARLFREQGYAGVSLRAIAAEAGMQAGSLYYHFDSKEDLVVEILDEGIRTVHQGVAEAVGRLPTGAGGEALLRTAILAHLRSLLRLSDYSSANVRIFGQIPEAVRQRSLPVRQAYDRYWDELLAEARGRGLLRADADLRTTRLLLIGALNASLEWFEPARGGVERLAGHYADLIWRGLAPAAGPATGRE
ncbi:transcriptional regulator, TetR family [Tistlia consotensis]|uniref:Transcriptional regulator, TetR family n=1 Tax=Tistlia consotensis USBA 355 TaxID=560819 RepID=A0A1Y6CLG5_9PROT|nr:TetR/AcrR family transcriptional regulator [Tistlia consotensis]SMF72333.1 transcriptional regulator, TetR family [Tistlia consotensis USBA 355]SNS08872.1 transcriptional regulator, TetR family [Tistlia consotensis]